MKKFIGGAMVSTMALCFLAAVIPLAAHPIQFATGLYAGAFLLGVLWIVKLLSGKAHWNHSPVHYPVLGFFLYALYRYFTSPIEYDSRIELFDVGLLTFFYFAIASNFHHSKDRSILLWVLFGLAMFEATYGLYQFVTHSPSALLWSRPEKYFSRAGGTYMCPNHLAGFLEMSLGLIIARIVVRRSSDSINRSALEKVLLAYVALVCMVALLASFSRSGWVAMVCGLLTLLIWGEWRSRAFLLRLGAVAGCLLVLGVLAFSVHPVKRYIDLTLAGPKFNKASPLLDETVGGRTFYWKVTWGMIQEKPLLGTGPGTWQYFWTQHRPHHFQGYTEYPHNDILNVASDYGVIGFLLVGAALLLFYRQAFQVGFSRSNSEQRSLAVGAVISVTVILIHSWFDFNLHILGNSFLFVAIMGLTVALGDVSDKKLRKEMHPGFRYALATAILLFCSAGVIWVLPSLRANIYKEKGERAKSFLQWDDALSLYSRANALDPRMPSLHEAIGEVYRSKSKWRIDPARVAERKEFAQKAIEEFRRSLELNPWQPTVLSSLASAYALAGDNESALKSFEDALKLDGKDANIYLALGHFHRKNGDDAEALKAFEKAADERWGYEENISAINIEDIRTEKK
jgi:O-antigen ligase